MPQLSIIIVNYNTYSLTSTCLRTLQEYTKGLSYEVILVDNASPDEDPERYAEEFPEIQLIKASQNLGFAKGNNLGIAQAQGDYILLLNSDTELQDNAILKAYQKMQSDESIGVLSSRLTYPDGKSQPVAGRFPSCKLELYELFRLQKLMSPAQRARVFLGFFFDHEEEMEADWVWGAFFLMPSKVIQELPEQKLPDDFFMYFEDVQWCYYIKKMGYKVLYYPKASLIHHVSGSSKEEQVKEKEFNKLKKITQHESQFLIETRGKFYTFIFYSLRAIKLLSLRPAHLRQQAWFYIRFIRNKLRV